MEKVTYQVTLFCTTNQFKPVSTMVSILQEDRTDRHKDIEIQRELKIKGITKICQKRYWTQADLKRYAYGRMKMRLVEL